MTGQNQIPPSQMTRHILIENPHDQIAQGNIRCAKTEAVRPGRWTLLPTLRIQYTRSLLSSAPSLTHPVQVLIIPRILFILLLLLSLFNRLYSILSLVSLSWGRLYNPDLNALFRAAAQPPSTSQTGHHPNYRLLTIPLFHHIIFNFK